RGNGHIAVERDRPVGVRDARRSGNATHPVAREAGERVEGRDAGPGRSARTCGAGRPCRTRRAAGTLRTGLIPEDRGLALFARVGARNDAEISVLGLVAPEDAAVFARDPDSEGDRRTPERERENDRSDETRRSGKLVHGVPSLRIVPRSW